MLMRRWTPPSQVPVTSLDNNANAQIHRTYSRWCKIIISTLLPIILFCFFIIYTLQKETFFNENYQHKQQDQLNHQQQLAFDTYIRDISNKLLEITDKNSINEKYLLHIQTKTLILLKNLDIKQKKDIILFLYQQNLLQNNQLNLVGANFNNVELTCPYDFHHLHLLGVHWLNAVFINCQFLTVNFNQAHLLNARFINSTISNGSFIETNLDNSHFIQSIIVNTNFYGASLIQADFLQADSVQGNNFTNTDLYQAKLTDDQFEGKKLGIQRHSFDHARYPNGSFQLNNPNESLILNGNAEYECYTDNQTIWKTTDRSPILSTDLINDTHWGNCSFIIISAKTRIYQNINLHSYSILIDTNNAAYSFFAYASCNQSYFEINMYRSNGLLCGLKSYSKPINEINSDNNEAMRRYGEYEYHIPMHTRRVEISFGAELFEGGMKCYFDNITFAIHQSQTK